MRTRTSARNQEILFRELFAPAPAPKIDTKSVEYAEAALLRARSNFANKPTLALLERNVQRAKYRRAMRGS